MKASAADLKKAIDALRGGNKIEAIKMLRAAADVGLREAKAMVDKMEKEMPGAPPSAGSARPLSTPPRHPGLAPGEVPPAGSPGKWFGLIAVAALGLAAAYFLGYVE